MEVGQEDGAAPRLLTRQVVTNGAERPPASTQYLTGVRCRENGGSWYPSRDMAYVIVQPCIDVKDASCVEVCPVDCIHTDDAANMYYIDPDECIDCGACVDPCPVDAIFPEDEVPAQWRDFIKINADYFKK